MNMERWGRIAFYIGLVIAVIAGFANVGDLGVAALVVLGIIVGALNVTGKEIHSFLVATIALLLVGSVLSALPAFGGVLQAILDHFLAFVGGAALLVGLREVFQITKAQ
ncbi:MAG: hypothetical protein HY369_02290 [Candidatus Aenigmarchaeota archaeon]|nr:hypothetical protein [Candidatus Aenigmarchaeota archaeon]